MTGHSLGIYHSILLNMGKGSRRPYYPAINSRHILSFLDFEQAKIYAIQQTLKPVAFFQKMPPRLCKSKLQGNICPEKRNLFL